VAHTGLKSKNNHESKVLSPMCTQTASSAFSAV